MRVRSVSINSAPILESGWLTERSVSESSVTRPCRFSPNSFPACCT